MSYSTIKSLIQKAEQGDAATQFELGEKLEKRKKYKEAIHWYRLAADQEYVDAQYRMGVTYVLGRGVSQDYQQAADWFRKAAEQGHAVARCSLGRAYESGQGVPKDYQQAVYWFRMSAEQGHAEACTDLVIT